MGACTSKGVSQEPSRAPADNANKCMEMHLADGLSVGPAAGAAQAAAVSAEAFTGDTAFESTPDQGGSGQSSACLTLSASGRSSLRCCGAKDLPAAELAAGATSPETGAERLAAVHLFCATPPADCCGSVSA